MHLHEYDHVASPANQAAQPTKPTPNSIPPPSSRTPLPKGRKKRMQKIAGKDNHKGRPNRPNSPTHQTIMGQASEGEISIHFMSRYDVLTYYHPLTIELVQKNELRIHQVLWYLW